MWACQQADVVPDLLCTAKGLTAGYLPLAATLATERVYQAFLGADNYHRWHSPVSGTIRKVDFVPGTYYAEAASEAFDPLGPNNSQGYVAHVATRALLFIEADERSIGWVGFIANGMAEVSSRKAIVQEGQQMGPIPPWSKSTASWHWPPELPIRCARRSGHRRGLALPPE